MSERPVQETYPPHGASPHPGEATAIADLPMYEALPPSRLIWTLASIVLLLVCLAIFIWTGIRGMDFGVDWDEKFQLTPVKRTIETSTLLPGQYIYPSFGFWLNLGLASPDILRAISEVKDIPPEPERRRDRLAATPSLGRVKPKIPALDQPSYPLRVRATYVVITALAVLWCTSPFCLGGTANAGGGCGSPPWNILGDWLPFALGCP